MKAHENIPVVVHKLASVYAPADIPWRELHPHDLLALSLDGIAATADSLASGAAVDEVIAEIGNTVACLGMLADNIQTRGSTQPPVMDDIAELGRYLLTMAPEEIGHADDENVVQTALRLLRRQYETTRH